LFTHEFQHSWVLVEKLVQLLVVSIADLPHKGAWVGQVGSFGLLKQDIFGVGLRNIDLGGQVQNLQVGMRTHIHVHNRQLLMLGR